MILGLTVVLVVSSWVMGVAAYKIGKTHGYTEGMETGFQKGFQEGRAHDAHVRHVLDEATRRA